MATSQVPAIIDALIAATAEALPDLNVLDGMFEGTEDPGDWLSIGTQNPQTDTPEAASTAQTVANMGRPRDRDETGSIYCAAMSWNGDWRQKDARDAVYATYAAVEDILRADPSLGLLAGGYMVVQIGSATSLAQGTWAFDEVGNGLGLAAQLTFDLAFRARI